MIHKVKISVVVITYNQQDSITKALDSLTCQKEWLHEIVISDDCSKDNTWQVVNEYAKKYPGLVKTYQNESNLGIYGNMLAGYKRATGNVIATLSGDDEYVNGCFEKACKYLEEQDVLDKVFHLYLNRRRHFVDKRPDYTFKNNLVTSPKRLSYALRGYICEPTFFSPRLLDRVVPPSDLGKCGDMYWCLSRMFHSDVILYLDTTSVIYNAGIGVSVTTSLRKTRESDKLVYKKILNKNEMQFGSKDLNYVRYLLKRNDSYFDPSLKYIVSTTWAYMKSIDLSLGLNHIGLIDHIKYIIRYFPFAIGKNVLE
ncbi:MAG: glycosyltransferase family 2 protein [Candidatus Limimorpha sp.]